jgi:hypothetical protein
VRKSEIGKIPFGDCPDLIVKDQNARYIAKAEIVKQDKNKILLLTLWDERRLPYARVFVDKKAKDWSIQYPDGKWKKSTLVYLIYGDNWRCGISEQHVKIGDETKKIILRYFKKTENDLGYSDPSALTVINSFMADINTVKNIRDKEKKQSILEKVLGSLPELPKDIDEWVRGHIIREKYMFYQTKRRHQIGTCSNCGREMNLTEHMQFAKHNEYGSCPNCYVEVQYKSAGISRKALIHRGNFSVVTRKGNDIYVQVIEAEHDYECTTGKADTKFTIMRVYYITEGNAYEWHRNKTSYWWGWNCKTRETYTRDWVQSKIPPGLTEKAYPYDRIELIKNSPFEHCGWETYLKHSNDADFIRYLCTYAKYPVIEYLQKMNLHNLVRERVRFGYVSSVNWKGKDFKSVLRIADKSELRFLVQLDVTGMELDVYQRLKSKGLKVTCDDLKFIVNRCFRASYNRKESFETLLEYTTHKKIINYTLKQQKKNPAVFINVASVLSDWKDYINECRTLQYEITEQILFPKSLHEAHARTSSIIEYENNKEKNKHIAALARKLIKKYSFEDDNFVIKVPFSVQELAYEGKVLKHCVRGYASRLKLNRCEILFIRKKSEPDVPFFTMEISNGRIVQVRTTGNKIPTADSDVQRFINVFKDQKLNKNIKVKVAV